MDLESAVKRLAMMFDAFRLSVSSLVFFQISISPTCYIVVSVSLSIVSMWSHVGIGP